MLILTLCSSYPSIRGPVEPRSHPPPLCCPFPPLNLPKWTVKARGSPGFEDQQDFRCGKETPGSLAEACTPLRFLLRLPQLCDLGAHCPLSNPPLCSFLPDQALTLIRGWEEAGRGGEAALQVGDVGGPNGCPRLPILAALRPAACSRHLSPGARGRGTGSHLHLPWFTLLGHDRTLLG